MPGPVPVTNQTPFSSLLRTALKEQHEKFNITLRKFIKYPHQCEASVREILALQIKEQIKHNPDIITKNSCIRLRLDGLEAIVFSCPTLSAQEKRDFYKGRNSLPFQTGFGDKEQSLGVNSFSSSADEIKVMSNFFVDDMCTMLCGTCSDALTDEVLDQLNYPHLNETREDIAYILKNIILTSDGDGTNFLNILRKNIRGNTLSRHDKDVIGNVMCKLMPDRERTDRWTYLGEERLWHHFLTAEIKGCSLFTVTVHEKNKDNEENILFTSFPQNQSDPDQYTLVPAHPLYNGIKYILSDITKDETDRIDDMGSVRLPWNDDISGN